MPILSVILRAALKNAAGRYLIGTIRKASGKNNRPQQNNSLMNYQSLLVLIIGVIVGCLSTWLFKPSGVVEKLVTKIEVIEVMPPLNCPEVELLAGLKKGDDLRKIIRPYAELKAAYVGCMNSIGDARK